MKIKSFRDLDVWHLSMKLAEDIYPLVRQFPPDERFGLSLQLRKAGVSIPSNIAEGSGYGTNRRYVHHLRIANGSDSELQTQLELTERLKFATAEQVRPLIDRASQVGKMLNGLIHSLDDVYHGRP
jgi:four helix bundle protein